MRIGVRLLAGASAILAVLLLGLIVFASLADDVWTGLVYVARDRWGIVTLVDLGIGLLFVAAWIAVLEGRWRRWLPWVLLLACFGNLVTAVYLLQRAVRAERVRDAFVPVRP